MRLGWGRTWIFYCGSSTLGVAAHRSTERESKIQIISKTSLFWYICPVELYRDLGIQRPPPCQKDSFLGFGKIAVGSYWGEVNCGRFFFPFFVVVPLCDTPYNFMCLLGAPEQMAKHGPVYEWEGGVKGEGYLPTLKALKGRGKGWQRNLLMRLLREKTLMQFRRSAGYVLYRAVERPRDEARRAALASSNFCQFG